MTCFENSTAVWNESSVNANALHLLAQQCLQFGQKDDGSLPFVEELQAPNTFFVQLVRLSVCLCIVTVLISLYNSVRVLEQPIISTATCSLYWVIFFALASLKSLLLVILLPAGHFDDLQSHNVIERCGFIAITVVQLAASFVIYLALHHEAQFRSSEYATIDSPPRRSCIGLRGLRNLCSWHRIVVMVITLVPLIYLVAIEISFSLKSGQVLPSGVVWPFILLLLLPRFVAIGVTIYLMLRPKHYLLQPTILAKVFLGVATILSLMEDIPNSVVTIAPRHTVCTCVLGVLSVYDLLQLSGVVAFIFYLLFIRSQFLRVEQESKLNLVEGLQKLLEVNGRKDVIRKDYTT